MHPLDSDGRFLKIEDLLSVGDFEPVADRHGVPMYFAESWGFAHFLLFSKEMAKEHAMDRLLDAFSRHLSPRVALQTVFGPAAASLDTRFYDYIKGGNFYEVRLPVEPAPPLAAPTAAAPADIAATLAELEASVKNSDAGRAYAEQAVRLAPEEPRSHESLALVDFMTEHHLAAAAECREAIRLNTRDAWTWFEAAQEVGRIGDGPLGGPLRLDPDEARESINDCERAVLACKGLTDAYRRLARLIPAASHVTQDDGKFLVLGRALFPDDGWIEIGHAQWARRNRRNDLAVKILDDVIARADALTPAEVAAARSLRTLWTTGPG
jgi:tetratricopeptide (TPR) repeat protein